MNFINYIALVLLSLTIFISCSESDKVSTNKVKDVKGNHKTEEAVVNFPVKGYSFYGLEEVKPKEAISVEEMISIINKTGAFQGNVNATLDGVCKKMGCWVTMVNKSGESIRVRFKDHKFFIPTDTPIGTSVILKGTGKVDTISIDMQKHYLDDAKEAGEEVTQDEYNNITEDLIDFSFISDGILVRKKQ